MLAIIPGIDPIKFLLSTCIFSTIYRTVSIWLKKVDTKIDKLPRLGNFRTRNFCGNFEKLQKSWYKTTFLPRLRNFRVSVEKFFSVPCLEILLVNSFYSVNFTLRYIFKHFDGWKYLGSNQNAWKIAKRKIYAVKSL